MSNAADMVVVEARVIRSDPHWVWVEAKPRSACGTCDKTSDCAASLMGSVFGKAASVFRLQNTFQGRVDELVRIGFPSGSLSHLAFVTYGLPVLFAVIGAIVGAPFGDVGAFGGCVGGLGLGFLGLKFWLGGARRSQLRRVVYLGRAEKMCAMTTCSSQ